MTEWSEWTTIRVKKATTKALKEIGGKSETYDAVIYRLIMEHTSKKEGQ